MGLEEKINDATDAKNALQKRLDAVNKSYTNTTDK